MMDLATYFNKTCRLCCVTNLGSDNMKSLFVETNGRTLAAKIATLTGMKIEPGDGLPSMVCKNCTCLVIKIVKFVESCQFSENILRNLFQKYHNTQIKLPPSINYQASTSQHLPSFHISHSSGVTKTSLPSSSNTSDFNNRTQSSTATPRGITSQHTEISQQSRPTNIITVNNSVNRLEADASAVTLHESSIPAGQRTAVETRVECGLREKENKITISKHSDKAASNFSTESVIHQSLSGRRNAPLHHKPEDGSSCRGKPGAIQNFHSTILQYTTETNTVHEKSQTESAKQPLNLTTMLPENDIEISNSNYEANRLHIAEASVQDVDCEPGHDSVSSSFDDWGKNPSSTRLTNTTLTERVPAASQPRNENGAILETTVNPKDEICGTTLVQNTTFPTIKIVNSTSPLCNVNIQPARGLTGRVTSNEPKSNQPSYPALRCVTNVGKPSLQVTKSLPSEIDRNSTCTKVPFDILQHQSGAPLPPPPPLVPIPKSWQQLHGVYSTRSENLVPSVNNRNNPLVSGLNSSHGKEHSVSAIGMGVASEPEIPNKTPALHEQGTRCKVTSTCASRENHSLRTLSASPTRTETAKSVSKDEPFPNIASIPTSSSNLLLSPSKISEVVRAIGSKLGVFLENDDDTVRNMSQVPEHSASAPKKVTFNIVQGIQVPVSHAYPTEFDTDVDHLRTSLLPPLQTQFPQGMTSTNDARVPYYKPEDLQRILSIYATPSNNRTKKSDRVSEAGCSGTKKRKKSGPHKKASTSEQKIKEANLRYLLEENLRSLLGSIKAALPSTMTTIPTQEALQSTVINPIQRKELDKPRSQNITANRERYVSIKERDIERLNKLRSFRIKITKTNGKYRSSSVQKYDAKVIYQNPDCLSTPECSLLQDDASEERPRIRISQLKPYQLAPFANVKRLDPFFVPGVIYKLTDANVINLLNKL